MSTSPGLNAQESAVLCAHLTLVQSVQEECEHLTGVLLRISCEPGRELSDGLLEAARRDCAILSAPHLREQRSVLPGDAAPEPQRVGGVDVALELLVREVLSQAR